MAARAIEQDDGRQLFRVIDQRARHAMHSIVRDRQEAASLIKASYPPAERVLALASLGDAVGVADPPALFAARCDSTCRQEMGRLIGAPVSRERQGEEWVIRTSRGGTLHMYAGSDGWYGIVWKTRALSKERDRAAQELEQIRTNANVHERRKTLMQ